MPLQQEFVSDFTSVISNKRANDIKKYFIQLVQFFKYHDFIKNNYKIIFNGHYYFTRELNTCNILEGFFIYEKLQF